MAYHIDCICSSCVAFRGDMFDDYCDTVEAALEAHGYALPKINRDGSDNLVSRLATEMMVAAGLIEDVDYDEDDEDDEPMPMPPRGLVVKLGVEIDMEYRRLFPNIIPFRKATRRA